jgi:hypothetical protein
MRVIVCGGREYGDAPAVYNLLDSFSDITFLIEGGAPGADRIARQWAMDRGVPYHTEHAEWSKYGNAAGNIRNRVMIAMNPDMVIAFPGNTGTADMVAVAEKHRVPVHTLNTLDF